MRDMSIGMRTVCILATMVLPSHWTVKTENSLGLPNMIIQFAKNLNFPIKICTSIPMIPLSLLEMDNNLVLTMVKGFRIVSSYGKKQMREWKVLGFYVSI